VRNNGAPLAELERRHVTSHASIGAVVDRRRALDQFEHNFGSLMRATSLFLVGIVGLVAFAATMNAQDVALSERLREVGTLRVLGMSPARVTYVFGLEALILALPGVALGLAGGVYLSEVLSLLYSTEIIRLPGFIAPTALTLASVLMLGFVLIAVAFRWRAISRMHWRGALSVKE
jgi:putative ABC transport system permease protein